MCEPFPRTLPNPTALDLRSAQQRQTLALGKDLQEQLVLDRALSLQLD
jgi:hypothetical protein